MSEILSPPPQLIAEKPAELWNAPARFMHMQYVPLDVVSAAKARIKWLLQHFDEVQVAFSGGKDSLVVLELVDQVYKELGRTDKVKAKFMDEELVADPIIDFVQSVAESGRYDLMWYCLPMYTGFYTMGKHMPFLAWDKNRVWHRQPPDRPYVVRDVGVDTRHLNENTLGTVLYPQREGHRVVELTGIRAEESMKRFLSVNRLRQGELPNYASVTVEGHLYSAKPIYDWVERDVFKFFKDYNIQYCPFYDSQVWVGTPLRVSSALHERAIGQFLKLKELAPRFYESIRSVFPEIETHYRYNKSRSTGSDLGEYAHTFDGLREYIKDTLDESHQAEATEYVTRYEVKRRNILAREPHQPLGRVSLLQLFKAVQGGRFVKGAALNHVITHRDIEYEQESA